MFLLTCKSLLSSPASTKLAAESWSRLKAYLSTTGALVCVRRGLAQLHCRQCKTKKVFHFPLLLGNSSCSCLGVCDWKLKFCLPFISALFWNHGAVEVFTLASPNPVYCSEYTCRLTYICKGSVEHAATQHSTKKQTSTTNKEVHNFQWAAVKTAESTPTANSCFEWV